MNRINEKEMKFTLKVATEHIQKDAVNMQKMNMSAASLNNPLQSDQNNFRRNENNIQPNYNGFIHNNNPQFEIIQNPTFSPHKTDLLVRPSEQILTIDTNPNNLYIANGRNNNQYVQNLQRNGSQQLNYSPNNNSHSPINNNDNSPNNKNHLQNDYNSPSNNGNYSPNNNNYPSNNNNYSPNKNNYSPNGTQYQSYSQQQYSPSSSPSLNQNYPEQYQPLQNISPSNKQQLPFGDQATLDPYTKSPSIPRVQRNNSVGNAPNYDLHSSPNNTQEAFNGNLDATYKIRDQMFSDPNHPAYGHQYDSLDWFKNEYENHRRYKHEKPRVSSNYEVYIIYIY